jgi:hypothetical protein
MTVPFGRISGFFRQLLQTFVPGGAPPMLKKGQAKLLKAGPPVERVKGILVFNRLFSIPPGASDHAVSARAEVLREGRLVSMLPHMHLRGKDFDVQVTYPSGETERLLRVPKYDFNWQINYYLAAPKLLPKGTILEVSGHFDNSLNNPSNPDPKVEVRYGEQTWEEMLNGFMEVAMEPIAEAPPVLGKAPALKP